MEVETWHEIFHDKLCGLVKLHLLHHLLHAVQTRTLGTEHRVLTLFGCLPQRLFELSTLTVGYVEHSLRLPDLSAAHLLHTLGEDHFITSLRHQLDHLINKVVNLTIPFRLSHGLVDTAGEIDHLQW